MNGLALEVLRDMKHREIKNRILIIIISIALLFITNAIWFIKWNAPPRENEEITFEIEEDEDNDPLQSNNEKSKQKWYDMIIADFTVPELNYLRENCNFVGLEIRVFDLRSQGLTLEEIAEILNMSVDGVKKISRKVNKKIIRIL